MALDVDALGSDVALDDRDEEVAVHHVVDELVDLLGLNWQCQLAYCRCSGFVHDDLLNVDVVETILPHNRPDVDGSIVLAAIPYDVAIDDAIRDVLVDPILDAIPDVNANRNVVEDQSIHDVAIHDVVVDGYPIDVDAILQFLLHILLTILLPLLPILVSSHLHDVDAIDVRHASNLDVHLLLLRRYR